MTEPVKTFSRVFRGYDPAAVDAHIEVLTTKQKLLLDDVESLRARLKQSGDEVAALRNEVSVLADTSSSPRAMQHRMAQMLRRAVDEISEMQAEAQAEVEAEQQKHKEVLADMAAQLEALEAQYEETRERHETELANMRTVAQSEIDEACQQAQREREQLLADAKKQANHHREQARRVVDEASQQRIKILKQLVGVYRELEAVPAALESAYQEQKNPPEAGPETSPEMSPETGNVVPLDEKSQHGVSPQ